LTACFKRRSAALRHAVWASALGSLAALPLLRIAGLSWVIAVPVAAPAQPNVSAGKLDSVVNALAVAELPVFGTERVSQPSLPPQMAAAIEAALPPTVANTPVSASNALQWGAAWLWFSGTAVGLMTLVIAMACLHRLCQTARRNPMGV